MKKIAVTGATGFVGKRFVVYNNNRYQVTPIALRNQQPANIDLQGFDAIVHLAGKAHDMQQVDDKIYFDVNYELTKQLADKAKVQGVPQFIYISSVKVYGDASNVVLNETSPCMPTDAYGASKLKAEQYLQSVQSNNFNIAIIRPPLVYGPEVKGNMLKMLQLARKNIFLPFSNSRNTRSMVFVDNLIELIDTIIDQNASGLFIAGDIEPVSTEILVTTIRKYFNVEKKLLSVPLLFRFIIKKIKPALYIRLFGSFVIDNTNTNRQLNFVPPYSTETGIAAMVKWYINSKQ